MHAEDVCVALERPSSYILFPAQTQKMGRRGESSKIHGKSKNNNNNSSSSSREEKSHNIAEAIKISSALPALGMFCLQNVPYLDQELTFANHPRNI